MTADALLRGPQDARDPVLRVILERARSGSSPRAREDDHVVCLAIEGGGMRAAVTAGMCVVLEAAGLTRTFDRIYGVSAGALNGWATAAGQAALGATHYEDAVDEGVVDRIGPLRGRPLVDFDLLFEELILARKPLSFERLAEGPTFHVLATSLETMSLRVLSDFAAPGELADAVRASAALPRFAGLPPVFRGERMVDGSLIEPLPFRSALRQGATHVLLLRSRPARYRRGPFRELGEAFAVRDNPRLVEVLRARQRIYNRDAAALQAGADYRGAYVRQVTVPDNTRLVAPLEANRARVTAAIRHGADAMAQAVLTQPVDLRWQPVVYPAAGEELGAATEAGTA